MAAPNPDWSAPMPGQRQNHPNAPTQSLGNTTGQNGSGSRWRGPSSNSNQRLRKSFYRLESLFTKQTVMISIIPVVLGSSQRYLPFLSKLTNTQQIQTIDTFGKSHPISILLCHSSLRVFIRLYSFLHYIFRCFEWSSWLSIFFDQRFNDEPELSFHEIRLLCPTIPIAISIPMELCPHLLHHVLIRYEYFLRAIVGCVQYLVACSELELYR